MDKKIGFIGTGNVATAIIKGLIKTGFATADQIISSRRNQDLLNQLKSETAIQVTTDNKKVAAQADVLFLAVKPHVYEDVIAEVKDFVKDDVIVVNIAAGKSIAFIEEQFGKKVKVARAMPNTPALVGEGMVGLCFNDQLTSDEEQLMKSLFASVGKVEIIDEGLLDAVVGASGSSPALLYMVIEAMADAVVKAGMPRQQAYTFAAQAMVGTGKMILETGSHPGLLKDQVCSPGGSTIEGVIRAEEAGLRAAVIAGVDATIQKSIEMNK